MRRITKVALGGVASCALILGGTQAASGALSTIFREHAENLLLAPDADRPFDQAKAKITIAEESDSTTFSITVSKIDPSLENTELGSHLHVGPCVEESGASAGPHYNHDAATGVLPARINRETEVWFDLVPSADGVAYAETTVPFVPDDSFPSNPAWVPGVMSVVIHELETDEDGSLWGEGLGYAGTRQACFPLSVPQWAE